MPDTDAAKAHLLAQLVPLHSDYDSLAEGILAPAKG